MMTRLFFKLVGGFFAAILDLDGDDKMELIVTNNYYEGGTTTGDRYTPAATKKLVEVSCSA